MKIHILGYVILLAFIPTKTVCQNIVITKIVSSIRKSIPMKDSLTQD